MCNKIIYLDLKKMWDFKRWSKHSMYRLDKYYFHHSFILFIYLIYLIYTISIVIIISVGEIKANRYGQ